MYKQRREAQRVVPTKARSPKWTLAGLAVCGQCGGAMYCTSSQRGKQYALYCGTQRTSGTCTGTYRTRQPVEAAVVAWLQTVVRQVKPGGRLVFPQPPAAPDPQQTERHMLTRLIEVSSSKLGRLTDAYTDGALDLAEFKRRRDLLQHDVAEAQARLAELDEPVAAPPAVAAVRSLVEEWDSIPVEERRDLLQALLHRAVIDADKTVELHPRWASPLLITFDCRGREPVLPTTG